MPQFQDLHARDVEAARVRLAEAGGARGLGEDLGARGAAQVDVRRDCELDGVTLAPQLPARGHAAVDGDGLVAAEGELERLQLGRDDPLAVGVGQQRLVPARE